MKQEVLSDGKKQLEVKIKPLTAKKYDSEEVNSGSDQ